MNTYSGVKNVDTLLIKVAVSFNASWWKTMKSVVLPNALPMIFAGLRLAAGTSLLLLVAAEMIAAQVGIGALILHYGDLMITDRLMAGVIVLSLLGLLFNLFLQWLERKAIPWKNNLKAQKHCLLTDILISDRADSAFSFSAKILQQLFKILLRRYTKTAFC